MSNNGCVVKDSTLLMVSSLSAGIEQIKDLKNAGLLQMETTNATTMWIKSGSGPIGTRMMAHLIIHH